MLSQVAVQLWGSWAEEKSQSQLAPTTNFNMPAMDALEFVKQYASAARPRFLAYESKQLAILGEISKFHFVIQPQPYLTVGLRSKLLSFEGFDTRTQRETSLKILFGKNRDILVIAHFIKDLNVRIKK